MIILATLRRQIETLLQNALCQTKSILLINHNKSGQRLFQASKFVLQSDNLKRSTLLRSETPNFFP